jgi:hypothetical protein
MPVEHVTVDVTATLRECFGERIELIKDLQPDQRICTTCKGLALVKREQPFSLGAADAKLSWPYELEYVCFCPDCYTGVQTLCTHCKQPAPLWRLHCDCPAARDERRAESDAKEASRRLSCRRVLLADYDGDMVYDVTTGDFRCVDGDDFEPDHTYFACKPGLDWVEPDADQVLETISERASEICADCEVDYKPGFKEALEKELAHWFKQYAVLGTIYWPDYDTVVVMPEYETEEDDEPPSAVVPSDVDGA